MYVGQGRVYHLFGGPCRTGRMALCCLLQPIQVHPLPPPTFLHPQRRHLPHTPSPALHALPPAPPVPPPHTVPPAQTVPPALTVPPAQTVPTALHTQRQLHLIHASAAIIFHCQYPGGLAQAGPAVLNPQPHLPVTAVGSSKAVCSSAEGEGGKVSYFMSPTRCDRLRDRRVLRSQYQSTQMEQAKIDHKPWAFIVFN